MTIQWTNVKDTPPPTDKTILAWCKDRYSDNYYIKIVWYGHNTSYYTGNKEIEWDEDGDVVKYQVDEDAWRSSEPHEDKYTDEYYYFEVDPFEWYSIINSPEDKES